ncbi:hypothetical protein BT69DRAFT_1301458 [Atractiella rhizophila]|nr:hypothetical protein BT69DRAFT_1301458 [Atractiella rhizophila]
MQDAGQPFPELVALKTEDGSFPTRSYLFIKKDVALKNVVVIAPASGVPAGFYFDFATYLANHGHATFVFSFRYVGESYPPGVNLRSRESRIEALKAAPQVDMIHSWANDMKAAIDFIFTRFRGEELIWCGHSNGGSIFTLLPVVYSSRFSRALFVGSFNGSIRYNLAREEGNQNPLETIESARSRVSSALTAARERGFLSGAAANVGEDMTLGVAEDWWGGMLVKDYIWELAGLPDGMAGYSTDTLMVCYNDDWVIGSTEPMRALMNCCPFAKFEGRWIEPKSIGWESCGHVETFRKKHSYIGGPWEYYREYLAKGTVRDKVAMVEWHQGPEREKFKL